MPTSPAHLPPQPPSLTSSTSHLSAPLEMGGSWEKQFFPVTHGLNSSENQNRMKVPTPGVRSIQSPASACFLPLQAHFSPEWAPIPLAFLLGAPGFRPAVTPAWNILPPNSHWALFLPSLSCCPNSTSFHRVPASARQPSHSPSHCLALLSLVVLITN